MQLRKAILLALASSGMMLSAHQVAAATPALTSADATAQAATTNFVTIIIDDMGFSDLGAFGGEAPTPHMNALADAGVVLNNFYASSTSSPSRAMLFTGKDNHTAGMGNMAGTMREEQAGKPGYEGVMTLNEVTFPQLLKEKAGYHTMMVGKWHMGEELEYYPTARGFTETRSLLLPGGDVHFISDAQGQILTSQWVRQLNADGTPAVDANGAPVWVQAAHLYVENDQKITTFPPNQYAADYFTEQAIDMLKKKPANTPFYLNMSYLSTHTPLQAPPEVTAKYVETYTKGWDVLRTERFERLKAKGILPANATLPPRPADVPAWNTLPAETQLLEATRMAVYAAMIEILDANVGKLVDHLKATGEYDNTVFLVYSDNGAEVEAPIFSLIGPRTKAILQKFPYSLQNFVTNPTDPKFDAAKFQELLTHMGGPESYIDPGKGWATLMNTPFHEYKATSFEGGVHTSAFITYPKQTKMAGVKYDCLTSVMDFAPTALEMAGILDKYPTTWNNPHDTPDKGEQPLPAMEGVSMANLLSKGHYYCNPDRYLGFEMDGVKGLRKGNWKLSQKGADENWYMYNLANDPSETKDLSADPKYAAKFKELLDLYFNDYAKRNGVVPVSNKRLSLLGAINAADGSPSEAVITAGDAVNRDFVTYAAQATGNTSATHDIGAQIRPAPSDVGKPGRIYVFGSYDTSTSEGGANVMNFTLTPQGLELVDAFTPEMPAYKRAGAEGLPALLFVPIFEGVLNVPGTITLNFAYATDEGSLVMSKKPLTVQITAPAAPPVGTP